MDKLLIQAYKKITYDDGDKLGELAVQINPESYKLNKSVQFDNRKKAVNLAPNPVFKNYGASTLSFDIIFDSTGVIPTGGKSVKERVKQLENLIYRQVGETKEPSYVIIVWGDLSFHGRLSRCDYSYTLFKPKGEPLRVKASLSFTEAVSTLEEQAAIKQEKEEGQYVVFTEDDNLIDLCQTIYGNPGEAPRIAAINELSGFRNIKPNTEIWFPKK